MRGTWALFLALVVHCTLAQSQYKGVEVRVVADGYVDDSNRCMDGYPQYFKSFEPCKDVIVRKLSYDCEQYIDQLSDRNFAKPGIYNRQPVFEIVYNNGYVKRYPIPSLCYIYDLCNMCGDFGKCIFDGTKSGCVCESGFQGMFCDERVEPDVKSNNSIMTAIILCCLLTVVLLLAVIMHVCRNYTRRAKQPIKQCGCQATQQSCGCDMTPVAQQEGVVAKTMYNYDHQCECGIPQESCSCSRPACSPMSATFNTAVVPPVVTCNTNRYCQQAPRSTVKITELPDDYAANDIHVNSKPLQTVHTRIANEPVMYDNTSIANEPVMYDNTNIANEPVMYDNTNSIVLTPMSQAPCSVPVQHVNGNCSNGTRIIIRTN